MYTSTRKKVVVDASQAILEGLGPNGGLYIFETVDETFFSIDLLNLSYKELSQKVFELFLNDFKSDMIFDILNQVYDGKNFPADPVILKSFDRFSFLELYHGKTYAFKDMALAVLPYLFEYAKKIKHMNKKTIILTATSGDTGSAALSGFNSLKDCYTIVLYPKSGVSEFQELQMQYLANEHSVLIPIEGNFDDCQNIVKSIFELKIAQNSLLSSANSINIGRIIPQIVYYLYAYLELVRNQKITFGDFINISVPTGNFGNIYAATIAKRLGVPIKKLLVASNTNNVLTELFNDHIYNINRSFHKTMSPSMDIVISSNFERYLYDTLNDAIQVQSYMYELKTNQKIKLEELNTNKLFYAAYASEDDTMNTIYKMHNTFNYLIDPHTAVAYHAYESYHHETHDDTHTLIISTASPFKFSKSVIQSLKINAFDTLTEEIEFLKSLYPKVYNQKMAEIIKHKTNIKALSVDLALEKIKKVIGEIDAKN